MENIKEEKNISILLPVLLNIIMIGAGHYYLKDTKKAFIFFPILIITMYSFYYISTLIPLGIFIFIPYLIVLIIYIYAVYDVVKIIRKKDYSENEYRGYRLFIFIIVFFALFTIIYLYSPIKKYIIPTNSMKNTIIRGDHIIVNKFDNKIKRGDIVAFEYPADRNIIYIKRCVATGGDLIFLKEKKLYLIPSEGNKYVTDNYSNHTTTSFNNMQTIVEPYKNNIIYDKSVISENHHYKQLFNFKVIKIPKDHCFMMGDNRDHSNDSRFYGPIPKNHIVGKVKSIFINFDDLTRNGILLKDNISIKSLSKK